MGELGFLNFPIISPKKTYFFNSPKNDNFVFKNVSPLEFMIAEFIKKNGSTGVEALFAPPKNEVHWEKTKFTYDLRLFMTIYQKS